MPQKPDANRYVLLTETGLNRLHTVRRTYRATVAEVIEDTDTPSVNTVKRVLRREPVFVSTLERLWDYFQRRALEQGQTLPYLIEGQDYVFAEGAGRGEPAPPRSVAIRETAGRGQGWISRQAPRSNRLFTGRQEVLERLHKRLQSGPAAVVADPQALTGLGGIGKTQTAAAYLYTYRREYDYLFWVNAETVEALEEGLAGLAEELKLAAAPTTRRQALNLIHDWFRTQSQWLLVLDNADDLPALAPHFPPFHNGHLIFTTQAANTVKWAAPVPLVKFSPEEGALLLLRRAGLVGIDQAREAIPVEAAQEARRLSVELDGLPLALNQAGAYLAETGCGVADYRRLYRESGLRLLDSAIEPEHASVTVTFTLALAQIAACSPYGKAAAEMVRLSAFLHPDSIPERIFEVYACEQSETPIVRTGQNLLETLCNTVCGYSMASRNPENDTLSLHRLVQKVTQDAMDAEERSLWKRRAVQAVSAATPDFEYGDWPLCDLLLPHWRLGAEYIREERIETPEAAYLLYQAGRYLRARAQYDEAFRYLQRAVEIAERVHGERNGITADYLDDLACLLRSLDRRQEAESLHLRAIAIQEQAAGPEHLLTAGKLHNLAVLYVQYAEFERATPLFLRALAIYEREPVPDRFLIAATLTQAAGGFRMQADFAQAERHCCRALEIYESLLEPEHIEIATACNNLALLYATMARYEEAEKLYLRALRINEAGRGREHPETAGVLWGLARVRRNQGRMAEADALFQSAIGIYTRHFDPEHARVTRILQDYAQFQEEVGAREESRD